MADQKFPIRKIQQIIDGHIDKKRVFGATISISQNNHQLNLFSGNLDTDSYYFLASVTKLYITALLLTLRSENKINLEDPITDYLSYDTMKDLHIFNLKDYSPQITIKHLLSNTSGLPDYFEEKQKNGISLKKELIRGKTKNGLFLM